MSAVKKFSTEFGGKTLTIEVGKLAPQANASCLVQYGDTVVLSTAVMAKEPEEEKDHFPLSVEFEEKMYAAGKIKGSRFVKREGRPTDEAIIVSRMIDRGLRPLFPSYLRNEVQVVNTVLSVDGENDPDMPAIIAASTALHLSNIPWNGPLVGIRIGQIDGKWIVNPTHAERENSLIDLAVSVSKDKVLMIEAEAKEISETDFFAAATEAIKEGKKIVEFIEKIRAEVGLKKISQEELELMKEVAEFPEENTPVDAVAAEKEYERNLAMAHEFVLQHLDQYLFNTPKGAKRQRHTILDGLKKKLIENLISQSVEKDQREKILVEFDSFIETQITKAILERDQRVDGRGLTDIRPLQVEIGLLPRTHGSALFERGETQVLSTVTLGSPGDEQTLDTMEEDGTKKYMHHYNDGPYAYGETGRVGNPGRRAIGHGALAEKALKPVLPDKENFPYTIRVVSEILSSNGSSSMASTCGSSLALMDAGVPITKPVAGIAMGLASDKIGRYKIITDLQDLEDGEGGMDFKVAGTRDGITAAQMDTKTDGLTLEIVEKTLVQAKKARLEILDKIESVIPAPRPELSPYAPRIISFRIDPEKIGTVIGPGGKVINEIIDTTGVQIDIDDDGLVMITGTDPVKSQEAVDWVNSLVKEVEVGEEYEGPVVKIVTDMSGKEIGAIVQLTRGQDGMCHVSQLSNDYINNVSDVVKLGDTLKVRVEEIDKERGRISLNHKPFAPAATGNSPRPERSNFDSRPPRKFDDRRRPSGPRRNRF